MLHLHRNSPGRRSPNSRVVAGRPEKRYDANVQEGSPVKMERVRILAASVALREFTIPELVAYSGSKERTVRSVLLREKELFERLSDAGEELDAGQLATGTSPTGGRGSRGPGRPATRWRVVDPQQIRLLVENLHSELAEAKQEATTIMQQSGKADVERFRLAAVKVAEDTVMRAWEEPNPGLRRVLAETVLNNLADAGPQPVDDEVGSPGSDWWNAAPSDGSSQAEEALRYRAQGLAVLAQVIDKEAYSQVLTTEQLAGAALAVSKLGPAVSSQPQVQKFFERLAEATATKRVAKRVSVDTGKVLEKIVTAKSPVSISDVAEQTGLPQSEVERAMKTLLLRKYVVQDPEENRPESVRLTSPVRVNEADHRAIGISVLPDKITGVLANLRASDSIVEHRDYATTDQEPADVNVVIRAISSLVQGFRQSRSDIIGLGVVLPGHINGQVGEVIFSPLFRQRDFPLAEELERETGLTTVVENDANAFAIHEQWFGDGTDIRDFAVILLTERGGLGSGLVSNNQIVYGNKGAGGELGHIKFEFNGEEEEECDCGKLGCLETVAGIRGILREVNKLGRPASTLADAAALAEKDETIQGVFGRAGKALGWGISVVLNLIDSERVILFAPARLVNQRYAAARLFMAAADGEWKKDAFSTAVQTKKLVVRELPELPVLEGVAASAVLGRVIRGPLEWRS